MDCCVSWFLDRGDQPPNQDAQVKTCVCFKTPGSVCPSSVVGLHKIFNCINVK